MPGMLIGGEIQRESFDPSARAFLDAAEREVFETQSILTISQLPISAIVDAAGSGQTRGAFTHHWPRRVDFEEDLAIYIAAGVRDRAAARLESGMNGLIGHATELPPIGELLDAGTLAVVDSIAFSGEMPIIIGLWSIGATNEAVRQCMAGSWTIAGSGLHETVKLLLAIYRFRVRPELSIETLSSTLATMMTSYALRLIVMGPEDDFAASVWTENVLAMSNRYTESLEPDSAASQAVTNSGNHLGGETLDIRGHELGVDPGR